MAAAGLRAVQERMAAAAIRVGRDPSTVSLIAVSKGRSDAEVIEAYQAGQRAFGENRAAELVARAGRLPGDIEWHFVGTLQRRKVKLVRPIATLLHSLDRDSLAAEWAKETPAPPVLVQVDIAGEPQKHGYPVAAAAAGVDLAIASGLHVVGLMAMAPLAADPEEARPWFVRLRELRDRIVRDHPTVVELSMGMTADFEVAVEEGATMIRVGRAIFGSGSAAAAP